MLSRSVRLADQTLEKGMLRDTITRDNLEQYHNLVRPLPGLKGFRALRRGLTAPAASPPDMALANGDKHLPDTCGRHGSVHGLVARAAKQL